jgi:DNA-binding transcriptional ArsR family regulator
MRAVTSACILDDWPILRQAPKRAGRTLGAVGLHRGDADLASVGRLLADPGRCRILQALGDGRALPASLLAREAGVAASTASEHLAKLVEGGLLGVERHGRNRYYRLRGPEVGRLLEVVAGVAPPRRAGNLREAVRGEALREGRTCYDHLAGRLGVAIFRGLLDRRVLEGHDGSFLVGGDRLSSRGDAADYRIGPGAGGVLAELGVELDRLPPRRPPIRYCVDWSEQCHHLAGGLGAAVAESLFSHGWLTRAETSRVVHVTKPGRQGLARVFGVEWPGAGAS